MMAAETYQFQLGGWTCWSIQDENGGPPVSDLFGEVPPQDRHFIPYPDDHVLDMSFNCLLIHTGDEYILLDSGNGVDSGGDGRLLQNLATLNITPDQINAVVLSHAHGDHYAGMLHSSGAKVFPNARYVMWRDEWLYYGTDEHRERERQRPNGEMRVQLWETYFRPLEKYLTFVDAAAPQIAPGITARPTPGHSKHHIAIEVAAQGETLLYTGDAFLHPLYFQHPEWRFRNDIDATDTEQSRRTLIAEALKKNALIHSFHFPFPGLGHLVEENGALEWQPVMLA
jgi:glyoxylase-like metal-dependent hydrolase (beta-lactamase superfamily II)